MTNNVIPQSYEQWRHCITVKCGLPLTPDYIEKRLNELKNVGNFKTKQFIELYGPHYHQQVLGWFQQAQNSP